MLYQINYTRRSNGERETRWMKNQMDRTSAVKDFIAGFYRESPGDAVRLEAVIEVEFTGDLESVDEFIDQLASPEGRE
jgi:hypothetical protein